MFWGPLIGPERPELVVLVDSQCFANSPGRLHHHVLFASALVDPLLPLMKSHLHQPIMKQTHYQIISSSCDKWPQPSIDPWPLIIDPNTHPWLFLSFTFSPKSSNQAAQKHQMAYLELLKAPGNIFANDQKRL